MQYTEVMDRIDGRLGPQYTLDQCVQSKHSPTPSVVLVWLSYHILCKASLVGAPSYGHSKSIFLSSSTSSGRL